MKFKPVGRQKWRSKRNEANQAKAGGASRMTWRVWRSMSINRVAHRAFYARSYSVMLAAYGVSLSVIIANKREISAEAGLSFSWPARVILLAPSNAEQKRARPAPWPRRLKPPSRISPTAARPGASMLGIGGGGLYGPRRTFPAEAVRPRRRSGCARRSAALVKCRLARSGERCRRSWRPNRASYLAASNPHLGA